MVDVMIKDEHYFLHTQAFKTWPLVWDPELALTPVMTGELQQFMNSAELTLYAPYSCFSTKYCQEPLKSCI